MWREPIGQVTQQKSAMRQNGSSGSNRRTAQRVCWVCASARRWAYISTDSARIFSDAPLISKIHPVVLRPLQSAYPHSHIVHVDARKFGHRYPNPTSCKCDIVRNMIASRLKRSSVRCSIRKALRNFSLTHWALRRAYFLWRIFMLGVVIAPSQTR